MIKNFFINIGLFLNILHEVKSRHLCVEYGCIISKSVNCPEGMCTKHHLMWHQRLEWGNGDWAYYVYHCQPGPGKEKVNVLEFIHNLPKKKPNHLKLVD